MQFSKRILFALEGAPMPDPNAPAPEQAPAGGEQDQMMAQLQQVAADIINQMGPDAAAMLAQMIMEMLQGGGAEQQLPPEEEQAVFARKGGRLVRVRN